MTSDGGGSFAKPGTRVKQQAFLGQDEGRRNFCCKASAGEEIHRPRDIADRVKPRLCIKHPVSGRRKQTVLQRNREPRTPPFGPGEFYGTIP